MQSADYDMFEDADELPMFYDDAFSSESNSWDEDELVQGFDIRELFELCVKPTSMDAFDHIGILLMWCLIFRLATQTVKIPDAVCHMTSAVTGVMALHYFFSLMTTVIIAFAVVAYVCLYLVSMYLKKNRGPIMGIISVAFLFVCELFLISETDWHKVRGSQMLLAMKAISLAFDTDYGVLHHLPSFLEFMGYVLCAGTSIFGPWIPYRDYVAAFNKPKWDTRWLWKVFVNTLAAFIFISLSSCWVDWLLPNTLWRWWIAYRDALSFRTSHYFVSFLSEASAIMSGLGNNGESSWTLPVARPLYIEIPRSLVQVVVYWNIPMHNWLKT
ncbi:protein-serine O-palmitoleoyltransferase porcupine isoform X5 [Bacillus rossius redtenbacheri]